MTVVSEQEEVLLTVAGLTVHGPRNGREVPIAEDIGLTLRRGEAVAIVGESGSGKSVTARALIDLLPHGLRREGDVLLTGSGRADSPGDGTVSRVAMVMQDPFTTLNPMRRVRDIICATARGDDGSLVARRDRTRVAVERLAEVGITDPAVAHAYPFELSGGMRQRVVIAAAIAGEPDLLIADEPTTALDVTTQADILALLGRLRSARRMSLILITHDLRVASSVCDRVYVMYAGEVVEELPAGRLLHTARHPYTAALATADPPLEMRAESLPSIPGTVPPPGSRPEGCRFAPRCPWAADECRSGAPPLVQIGTTRDPHEVRCARVADGLDLARLEELRPAQPVLQLAGAPLIVARGVTKRYGDKCAVDGVDFKLRAGESVGIVGESGSGKTSLARMMIGLESVTSGSLQVAGVEVAQHVSRAGWRTIRSAVQMAFQDPSSTLNPARSIDSTLREALRFAGAADPRGRAIELLQLVGLDETFAPRRPQQLSGGERQRVAIARALARDPQVLLCDEVVSALDVSVQARVLNLLNSLRHEFGLAYVFITHDLAVVRQIADRIYVMRNGQVVEHGPTADVMTCPQHPYTRALIASVPASSGPGLPVGPVSVDGVAS